MVMVTLIRIHNELSDLLQHIETKVYLLNTDIDDCNPNPCLNSGACIDGVDSYTCGCAAGYTGTNCETGEQ